MSAEIAKIIADQLTQSNNGYSRLKAMIGASNFTYSNDKLGSLSFKFKMSRKASYCLIELDYDDTYTVSFYRGDKMVKEYEMVYADNLKGLFEYFTGLYLSL